MATLASFFSGSLLHRQRSVSSQAFLLPFRQSFSVRLLTRLPTGVSGISRTLILARSSSSSNGESRSKNSVLTDLIREIEPLDVSLIQKDVPPTTLDAMKRTISGMLGLLPSDQFEVLIEALWQPLSKLLISSMMTGYTLRNAEYRLYLEENLEIYGGNVDKQKLEDCKSEADESLQNDNGIEGISIHDKLSMSKKITESTSSLPDFGVMNSETKQYILKLQSHLSSVKRELREVKRKNTALQMQQFVGEEKNDLLDYLRSLQPEKVVELSEPTTPELKETIHSVVHGLLATLSHRMRSWAPDMSEDASTGIMNIDAGDDCIDVLENTSLQFHPHVSLNRDYLARLLFWCMLLGHYLRGLEYRLELTGLLSLPCALENEDSC